MKSYLLPMLEATIDGTIDRCAIEWDSRAAVTVVLASAGYPGKYEPGKPISGPDDAAKLEDIHIFQPGTRRVVRQIEMAGTRIFVVALPQCTIVRPRQDPNNPMSHRPVG